MLAQICEALAATPNDLLLPAGKAPARSARNLVLARINAGADTLSLPELVLAACLIECISARRSLSRR